MDSDQIRVIIERLENVKATVPLYASDELPPIANFLQGFNFVCVVLGTKPKDLTIADDILIEHGWTPSSLAPLKEMRERGWGQSEIAHELLSMTIENWKRLLNEPANTDNKG